MKSSLTKYPVVFIHGFSWKDLPVAEYWFGIPDHLRDKGAAVYVTQQDAWQGNDFRAKQDAEMIGGFLSDSKADKVNLICHSQGGLDARYMIEKLTVKDKDKKTVPAKSVVASYTSIGTPHRGTSLADAIWDKIGENISGTITAAAIDAFAKFYQHDKKPNSKECGKQMTRKYMKDIFNKEMPLIDGPMKDGIYYQSYASMIKTFPVTTLPQTPADSAVSIPLWTLVQICEGDNDMAVSVESAKFGNFRGVITGDKISPGVSHLGQINHLFGAVLGFDAKKFYEELLVDLQKRGY